MVDESVLKMVGITKHFDIVHALDNVNFSCNGGEVNALVGENGAGKSTLMNILSGSVRADSGDIYIKGKKINVKNPKDAYHFKIGFVHQETNLFTNLSVWENIFIANELYYGWNVLQKRTMVEKIRRIADYYHYNLDPNAQLRDLSPSQRKLVEITRALIIDPGILIMDEPTAALTDSEVQGLFDTIQLVKAKGTAVIYISHRLEEIEKIADRVTILKDGQNVGILEKGEISREHMITMMVGRPLTDIYPPKGTKFGKEILTVKDLCGQRFTDVSLSVRCGEILGIGGLDGQGQRDFIRAVYGDINADRGSIILDGSEIRGLGVHKRIKQKMCYITYDRRAEGVIPMQSIRNNVSAIALPTRMGIIRKKAEIQNVTEITQEFQVKMNSILDSVETLSGGNQQKVLLSRFVLPSPKVLLVDEPTRGIDVGSRMAIYQLLRQLADSGMAIIMLTSDMMELIGLSDRIGAFCNGRLVKIFTGKEATEEEIMKAFSGTIMEAEYAA